MMFCAKCGSKLSDGAAFCPNCGAPVSSGARSDVNTPSGAGAQVQRPPEAAAPAMNAAQYGPANITPPVFSGAPPVGGPAGGQGFVLDKKQAIRDVCAQAVIGGLCGSIVVFLLDLLLLAEDSVDSMDLITGSGIVFLILIYICTGIVCALPKIIFEAVAVRRRFRDPNDPAYKIGVIPDRTRKEKFRKKHKAFLSVCNEIIAVLVLVFMGVSYIFILEMRDPVDLTGDPDPSRTANASVSAASAADDPRSTPADSSRSAPASDPQAPAAGNRVAATTWFAESYFESTIILEPNGDCAYFFSPASGPGVYYYGHYTINKDRVDATFYFSETERDFPETDVSFEIRDNSLIYNGEEKMYLYPGEPFERREEAPGEVRDRPPTYLDQWIENGTQGFDHWGNGAAGQPEEGIYYVTEDVTFYFDGDEQSWITLYLDGTFLMRVNLYEGFGSVSGVYEGTGTGFHFEVTNRDFGGFMGDDVERFDMIVTDSRLMYRGEPIGTTFQGTMFY